LIIGIFKGCDIPLAGLTFVGNDGNWSSNMEAAGIFAGQDACPCRRADGTPCIGTGEFHPLIGYPVYVRSLIIIATETSYVTVTEIIHEKEYDIRSLVFRIVTLA
jgi:hypothetical protein